MNTGAAANQSRPKPHRAWRVVMLAGLAAGVLAAPAGLGQVATTPPAPATLTTPAIPATSITGRSFAGVRLPLEPVAGPIDLRATRAVTWTEAEPDPETGQPRTTTRLLLDRDVELRLGTFDLRARRAAVWLERLEDGPLGQRWQVYAVLDGVSTPSLDATITLAGERLPIQGIIEVPRDRGVSLRADRTIQGRPERDPLVIEGERLLSRTLRRVLAPPPEVPAGTPRGLTPDELARQGLDIPALATGDEGAAETDLLDRARLEAIEQQLGSAEQQEPIFASDGLFTFAAGRIEIVAGPQENAVVLSGRASIQYWEKARDRTLELVADRAVVFLEPGPLAELGQRRAGEVRGVYLEGDVRASDGRYNLRAPRVYYSVKDNRAVLIDAVFWTFDERRGMPLYVRAKTIAQESQDQFRAQGARFTNTAFFEPDLAIGASSVTVSRRASRQGDRRLFVDARDVTLRAGGVPFFYWPVLRGEPDQSPLKDVRIENANASGAAVKTTWNAGVLLGLRSEREVQSELLLDYYFDRGVAVGTDTRWSGANHNGGLFAYALPSDTGRDVLPTGERKDQDGEFRGLFTAEHRAQMTDQWALFAEGSFISDPTLVDAFFSPLAKRRREFTTSLYARRLEDNTAFTARVSGTFNDFIANQYLLQTPGYTVERLPDVGYVRLADNLLPDAPGLLTYSSSYRYTYMRLRFDRIRAEDRGFRDPERARRALGTLPGESIADVLRRQGLSENPVSRFDTRHEIAMPLSAGPVNLTPFVAARGTVYSEDFESFSRTADQPYRGWAGAGLTASAELQRIYNDARSRLLDINRLRHIIQPQMTVFHAGATLDAPSLPVYDPEVEQIQSGTAWRFALNQTLQTQRGGPGRWRSVDLATWDTELVLPSGDTNTVSGVPTWLDGRPERSSLGDAFIRSDGTWQLSEVVGLGGGVVFDFGSNQLARSNAGVTLQHSRDLSSYAELRSIGTENETFANFGATYRLTRKYTVSFDASYNTELGQIQTVSVDVRRSFPNVVLGAGVSYDAVTDRTSFGFVFQPLGVSGGGPQAAASGARGEPSRF